MWTEESQNLHTYHILSLSRVSEQQRECLCLLLITGLDMRQSLYFKLLISVQRQSYLLLSTLRRDLIMPFKRIFLPKQVKWEWPMSSIFMPCFTAQTSDRSCCNPVCKVRLEGMKTKQKKFGCFFFSTACRSKGLHVYFHHKAMFVLCKLPTIEIIMKALTAIFVDLQLTYNNR